MSRRKRRTFTDEFKADAVRLCQLGDRSVAQIASDLDLTEGSLREWLKRAEEAPSAVSGEALSAVERNELVELRKRVKRLEMEREILKKATAFFAKETT
jgi:transposase-like protein